MNLLLKILTALALIAVIAASSVYIIKATKEDKGPDPENGSKNGPDSLSEQEEVEPPEHGSYRPDPKAEPSLTGVLEVAEDPIQPSYVPINQPAYLQMLRQEGKTYRSVVLGKMTGRASKSDWGLQGAAYFNYIYGLESNAKVVKNDGVTIVEERTFEKVQEELVVSEYEIGIDLGARLEKVLSFVEWATSQAAMEDPSGTAAGIYVATVVIKELNGKTIPVKKGWVDLARNAGIFEDFPQIDPEKLEQELRMFTHGDNERLLEGKKVRITFVDGQGIKTIEPLGDCVLSEKERDIIIRSNFALDHYIFPDRQVSPGETWSVAGDTFSGFLDPRLAGKADGKVTILRTPDFVAADGAISKKLKLTEGEIVVRESGGSRAVAGQLSGLTGVLTIPDAVQIVTDAVLSGQADYQSVSTDHLLFEARHSVKPSFEIQYKCSVD